MTTSNDYENDLKELFIRVQRYLRKPSRKLSETMHMYRNVLPYFDAIFSDYEKFTLELYVLKTVILTFHLLIKFYAKL